MRIKPSAWIPTLFAAEAIPSVLVTFVSLLMFLQMGATSALSTFYCGLLFLPWALKSFMRHLVYRIGYSRPVIIIVECCIFLTLVGMAFTFPTYSGTSLGLFGWMFGLSLLCAWHELAARMYYEDMLYPRYQRYYGTLKMTATQVMMVVTYGLLIIVVGGMQVIYRSIPQAWSMALYLMAGAVMLLVFYHLAMLPPSRTDATDTLHPGSMLAAVRTEMGVIERIRRQRHWRTVVWGLFWMLLPQSLMFYSRVLFLMAPSELGGLSCSIQDVGMAQGTVGVIAFSVGIALGRRLMHWVSVRRLFWWVAVPLGLSPLMYVIMTFDRPTSLLILCIATFQAQFCFGFGLNLCLAFVHYLSGDRYRNTINYLYVPVVALVMCVPMMLSGWLADWLGFRTFFILDAAMAPVSWLYLALSRSRRKVNS